MYLEGQAPRCAARDDGYAMAALLVGIAVMHMLMSMAMPVWTQAARREKEAELLFRGEQYARAIELYQRKFAATFPPSIDVLVEQRFLRRKYKDPITGDEFQVLYQTSMPSAPGVGAGSAARPGQPTTSGQSGPAPVLNPTQPTTSGRGGIGSGGGPGMTSPLTQPQPLAQARGGAGAGRAPATTSTLAGPQGGVLGVVSKSTDESLRLYNGRNKYNEWVFVYVPATAQPGQAPGQTSGQTPGQPHEANPRQPGAPTRLGDEGRDPGEAFRSRLQRPGQGSGPSRPGSTGSRGSDGSRGSRPPLGPSR